MTLTTAKWTIDDYHQMIKSGVLDDRKVELLRGEIVEMAPEGELHFFCRSEAGDYLAALLGNLAKVRQDGPITLPNCSEPEPDLAVVQPLGREYLEHHPYPENIFWLVEYSESSLSKDLEIKSKIYAEVGIPEYWVANLKQHWLVVFRDPIHGEYTSMTTLTGGMIQPVAFPTLSVAIDRMINS